MIPIRDKFPMLVPLDQAVKSLLVLEEGELEQLRQKAAYAEGHIAWSYYRVGKDLYSVQEITKRLEHLVKSEVERTEPNPIVYDVFAILNHRHS